MSAFVDPIQLGKMVKDWRPGEIQAQENVPTHPQTASADQMQHWQGRPSEPAWQPLEYAVQEQWSAPEILLKTPEAADACEAQSWQPQQLDPIPGLDLPVGSILPFGSQEAQHRSLYFVQEAQKKAVELLRQAEVQASQMIKQAEARAAGLVRQAENQAAQVTQNAHAQGVSAAQAETEEQLRTATSIVEEVNAWREDQLSQAEMMILRLVIEIAQSIFGEGLPLDPETLGQSFSRALAQAKTLGSLRVYVNPEDVSVLSPYWTQKQSALSGQQIQLIPSDIIKRGGCFVEGQYGSVDARVESQFQLVKETLLSTKI
jgi:flagellar assembly protein FliH